MSKVELQYQSHNLILNLFATNIMENTVDGGKLSSMYPFLQIISYSDMFSYYFIYFFEII